MARSSPILLAACWLMLMLGVAVAQPFHHAFGEWREYNRDWLAVCPDTINEDMDDFYGTSCFASTYGPETNSAGHPAYQLTLILDRLDGALEVAFTFASTDGTVVDESRPLTIRFGDAAPMQFAFGSDLETRHNTMNRFFVTDAQKRDTLIDAMRERTQATLLVPVDGSAERLEVPFSMHGVLASLDFMRSYARRVEDYN